jgi:hypothetical protein
MKHGFSDENIMLLWAPCHSGIQNNEDVDVLAREESRTLLSPKPVISVPPCGCRLKMDTAAEEQTLGTTYEVAEALH